MNLAGSRSSSFLSHPPAFLLRPLEVPQPQTPGALKRFAEMTRPQMRTIFRSELVWQGNNKLGSLRQSNCVWRVANWAVHAYLRLWNSGRGFSYARNSKGLHAVYTVVESFQRGILSQAVALNPPSSLTPATADSVSRKEIVLTQRYCPGFRTRGFTIGQVRRGWTQSLR